MKQALSFCRMCMGHCGVVVEVDDQGSLQSIRGDQDDPQTLGFACYKGMKATESHNSPERILHPLKRQPDGTFARVELSQALDEIAERISTLRDSYGPDSIAGYKGGGGFFTSSSVKLLASLLKELGSHKSFSSVTIDQSSKAVSAGRIGIWPAGRDPFDKAEVLLLLGANPLVTISTTGFDNRNPVKRLKAARERGMKLIVVDPRETETAKFADLHLQVLPGEDAAVMAGLLHIVLKEGWEDKEFCADHAGQLDELRSAVANFTPDWVASRAGISSAELYAVARAFAYDASRGCATSATGPDMSAYPNLAEHLIETLNVICGRFLREGEEVPNPGVLKPRWPRPAQVIPAPRWWEQGYQSRVGDYGLIEEELPTGTLAEEILQPGDGQVRCLIVHGGNPAAAVPDQRRILEALRALDLLVVIEPFMSVTAQLADYILPPTLPYERADLPLFIYEELVTFAPYTRYTPAVATPPSGAEVYDDHHYFWELARRLDVTLHYFETPLDMSEAPTTEDLLQIAMVHADFDLEHLKAHERGVYVDKPQRVTAADPALQTRFSLLPADVAAELQSVYAQAPSRDFGYRFAVRRMRDTLNSACRDLPSIKQRVPYNRVFVNPLDLQAEGCADGDRLRVCSEHGSIEAIAAADPSVRQGVVSVSHGFGGLPDADDYLEQGSNTNLLISTSSDLASINAMPRMSGFPVRLEVV
ncbi:nitrate reductase [Halieaceae bacterium IMCC14734]|uniref:Nitrate reductase n=1 Tax=Candidatus Litorirhabdus singularis TaxID=2518993 RepID=A0ABT3TID4_9GAMM|nr:molybdopterin-dependent oxidoreductase [Candidatus Litorirhabdus singularis]MCX2981975.1 nitrate reductase [Candidatus Litorirhabdus singularis]